MIATLSLVFSWKWPFKGRVKWPDKQKGANLNLANPFFLLARPERR
jgi:hypothetical protein